MIVFPSGVQSRPPYARLRYSTSLSAFPPSALIIHIVRGASPVPSIAAISSPLGDHASSSVVRIGSGRGKRVAFNGLPVSMSIVTVQGLEAWGALPFSQLENTIWRPSGDQSGDPASHPKSV